MFRRKDSWLETLNIQTLQKEIIFFNHAEADCIRLVKSRNTKVIMVDFETGNSTYGRKGNTTYGRPFWKVQINVEQLTQGRWTPKLRLINFLKE